jgi:DNA-binding NtrC family response regulator
MATILVIDDHNSIRMLLRTVLEGAGHEVMEASNGRLGLAAYRERPADLVITDIHMPEMNGLDLILELTRAFLNVKVIAISGAHDTENVLDAAKLLGARHTLHKPFSVEALLKTVHYELAH